MNKYEKEYMKRMQIAYILLFTSSIIYAVFETILFLNDPNFFKEKFFLLHFLFIESVLLISGFVARYRYKKIKQNSNNKK